LGKLEDALNYVKKSVSINPNSAEVLDHLGDIYEKMGQIDNAVNNGKKHWNMIKKMRISLRKYERTNKNYDTNYIFRGSQILRNGTKACK